MRDSVSIVGWLLRGSALLVMTWSAACSQVTAGQTISIPMYTGDKTKPPTEVPVTLVVADRFNHVWLTLLEPGQAFGLGLRGRENLPFRVQAWQKDDDLSVLDDLRMSMFRPADPHDGASYVQIEQSDRFWHSPAMYIREPGDGDWYVFVIRNLSSETTHQVHVSVKVTDAYLYSFHHDLYPGDSLPDQEFSSLLYLDGVRLRGLVAGQAHQVTVSGGVMKLELFGVESGGEPEGDTAFILFNWPDVEDNPEPVRLVAESSEPDPGGLLELGFTPQPDTRYGLALIPTMIETVASVGLEGPPGDID